MKFINNMINTIMDEVRSVKEKDPAAKTTLEVLVNYSGLHAVLFHRAAIKKSFSSLQE